MRIMPEEKYEGVPSSQVAIGCAYENVFDKNLSHTIEVRLKNTEGYATLEETNKSIRANLPISKRIYYRKAERISLSDFLKNNKEKCIVCVLGHYIFVDGKDYYSYFDNDSDVVVCVWYIDTDLIRLRKETKVNNS